ncbi:MAG: tetratricopeptide repeat protein [Calditrichia bacterium]
MDNFGIHDRIEINEREFHIHTGTVSEKKKIISEVFEKGMFLTSRQYNLDLRKEPFQMNYEYLNKITKEFHNSVIDELESLYRVEEKLNHFKHPISRYHLGTLFLKRNLYEEAIRQFSKAIEQDSRLVKAYIGLGISYLKSRAFEKALNVFQKALELGEKYPDLMNYTGLAHLFLGEFDRATTLFKEAININPNYYECQFNLGVALYKSALEGARDPKAVAVPARIIIYLKQVRDLERYRHSQWQSDFNQLIDLLKDNNHAVILPEIEKFQLQLVDFSSEKDKIYEFYLRFLFGGNELTPDIIEKYESFFNPVGSNLEKYPDYWNDLGIFHLIKSRSLYLRALSEFEKAIELAPAFSEAKKYRDMIKSNEKGFLILLRAILK